MSYNPNAGAAATDSEAYHYTTWEKKTVPNANAFVSVGNPQTITGAGTTAANNDADGAFIKHSTSAVLNASTSQIAAALTTTKRDWKGLYIARTKSDTDLSTLRFWCGWFSNTPVAGSDPTGHCAGFRFDTGAGDTQFMCCTKDGATLNATASGITPATATRYLFRVEMAASSVLFYINDVLVHTASSNLPGASTSLGEVFSLTTLSAAVRSWNLSSLRMMHYQ